jgi:hypothetical protein
VTLVGSALYYVFIINGGLVWREIGYSDRPPSGASPPFPASS